LVSGWDTNLTDDLQKTATLHALPLFLIPSNRVISSSKPSIFFAWCIYFFWGRRGRGAAERQKGPALHGGGFALKAPGGPIQPVSRSGLSGIGKTGERRREGRCNAPENEKGTAAHAVPPE